MRRASFLLVVVAAACADGEGVDTMFASGTPASSMSSTGATGTSSASESSAEGLATTDTPEPSTTDPSEGGASTTASVDCDPGLSACGVLCVDIQTDSTNCGGCGISCVVPNAASSCQAGACAVGECTVGWFDCDGDPNNGCEAQTACSAGELCTTECGSTGVTSCSASCEATCDVPAETCNAIDDDCNGSCDEGAMAGCRESVHRANGPNGHYYTNVLAETSQAGRSLEFQDYFWLYAEQHDGLTALHRCDLGEGRFFLTTSGACEGAGSVDDTLGYLLPAAECGATALYRLYGPSGTHFYTTSTTERDNAVANLGFTLESTAGYVWTGP